MIPMQKEDVRVLKAGREVEDDQLYGPWVLVQRKTRRRVAKPNRIVSRLDHTVEGDSGQGGTKPHWNGLNKRGSSKGIFEVTQMTRDQKLGPIQQSIR